MDVLPGTLDQLAARLEMLERRVAALENPSAAPVETATLAKPQIEAGEELSFAQTGSVFPVLGKAMLGIAGAYMLRAVAESTTLPRLAIAAVAIVYALVWLIVAARVSLEKWISSAIYAGTSSLILAPMLWELTLSFKVMTPPMTAGVLCVFVIVANSLAWKQNRTPICWVANVTAAVVALALPVATHELTPFLAALLLMALLGEYAAGSERLMSLRPFVALASDAAIWSLIFIYSSPASTRMDYPAMSMAALILPGCILFLIFGASIVFRCARIGATISVFEIAQAMVAFLLAAWSTVAFAPGRGTIVLGIASCCYRWSRTQRHFCFLTNTRNGATFMSSVGGRVVSSWLPTGVACFLGYGMAGSGCGCGNDFWDAAQAPDARHARACLSDFGGDCIGDAGIRLECTGWRAAISACRRRFGRFSVLAGLLCRRRFPGTSKLAAAASSDGNGCSG